MLILLIANSVWKIAGFVDLNILLGCACPGKHYSA